MKSPETAGVNKALIYYYFKSKEDILDQIVHSLLGRATSLAMDFVHQGIVHLIKENRLDIEPRQTALQRCAGSQAVYKKFEPVLPAAPGFCPGI